MGMKFNNLKKTLQYIQKWHNAVSANEKRKKLENPNYTPVYPDLDRALRACKRKHDKYYGCSKYAPHQGYHEQERRRGCN